MRLRTNAQAQEELLDVLDQARDGVRVPRSALKALREAEGMSQEQAASRAGMTQEALSRLETGARSLSADAARRLAPVFGASADELQTAHAISALKVAAAKGEIEPRAVLEAVESLAGALPDNDLDEQLSAALMDVLGSAVQTYNEAKPAEKPKASTKAATKSRRPEPTRNDLGIRKDKPYQGR